MILRSSRPRPTRARWFAPVAVGLALAGCTTQDQAATPDVAETLASPDAGDTGGGTGTDAATEPTASPEVVDVEVAPAPCTLSLPSTLSLGEGRHATLAVTTSSAVQSIAIVSGPEGLTAAIGADGLRIDVPYGTAEAPIGTGGAVRLRAQCDGAEAEAAVEVTTHRITWKEAAHWRAGVDGPVGREYGAMWMDAKDPEALYVHGGFHYEPKQFTPAWDTWKLDLGRGKWTQLTPTNPPTLVGGRVAPVAGASAVIMHGGLDGNDVPERVSRLDYALPTPAWTEVAVSGARPDGDYTGGFAYDPVDDQYVQACGANNGAGYHCYVYTMKLTEAGAEWSYVPLEGDAPAGRNGFIYAMDVPNHRLVIFSGERGSDSWTPNLAQDTWALELDAPIHWVRLSAGETPAIGRRNGAYLHDPVGQRLFAWGGTADGDTTLPGLFVLSLERGHEVWQRVYPGGDTPPERTSGIATYDAARDRCLVGFGNGVAVYADLWSLAF